MKGQRGAVVRRAPVWLCVVLCWCAGQSSAHADDHAENYEMRRVHMFLADGRLEPDPAPEGKRIAYLRFERRRVFEPDDLQVPIILPSFNSTWPNTFHWLTQESRIRRDVLLREGEPYRQLAAEETERNLRALGLFALVKLVAVKTDDPERVGLVVYTRDIWSLRFEQTFSGAADTFTVSAQLIEHNFLGNGSDLGIRSTLDPLRYTVGETYLDQRFLGKELRVAESFDVYFSRQTGRPEGTTGSLRVGRPFYNLAQRFAFDVYASYYTNVFRDARAGKVVGLDAARNACELGKPDCLARVFDDQRFSLDVTADYSAGERSKHVFTLGFFARERSVAPNAESGITPEQHDEFVRRVLPRVRRDIYPYVRYRLYIPEYVQLLNLTSFGRAESVRVGPYADGLIGVPLRAWGASSDGMVVDGTIGYVWSEHDALIDFMAEALARLEAGSVVDQRAIVRLRGASPSFDSIFGRMVFRVVWDGRANDTQRTAVILGGDNGLRGYEPQRFGEYGGTRVVGTLEYRSKPWLLQSIHIGGVAFYDVGTVYKRIQDALLHHTVGAGVRVLLPQLNRTVFALDIGVPLRRSGFSIGFSYGSEQAVPLTLTEDLAAANQANATP